MLPEPGQVAVAPPGAPMLTIARRADFLAAARARRQSRPGFVLQGRQRGEGEAPGSIRVGYTCSRKVGNAVARNRAKRRLRAAARAVVPLHGRPGWDYVLIGRPEITAARPFPDLCEDLASALLSVHGSATGRAPR